MKVYAACQAGISLVADKTAHNIGTRGKGDQLRKI
jgi:hypothetical protein